MRVGLFTNNYLPFRGGVTTAVETLREGLDALGHRAWVFAPAPARALPEPAFVFRYPSVPAPTYPGFALPLPLSPRLARTARQLQLEIFHAQHPFLLGPAARAVRLSCRFADATDLVVAPSGHIAQVLASRGVRAPVVVVPTGVDLERFRPGDREAARRRLGLPADAPICLYVGRLDREKSVERIIEAFASIAEAVSGARLLVVGQGSHAGPLEGLAAASRAREGIHFVGGVAREELPPYYQAADLFLFASETETQGLVLA